MSDPEPDRTLDDGADDGEPADAEQSESDPPSVSVRTDDETPDHSEEVDLTDPGYYLSRELSELAFQRRVLHEALDERNPLLERVKFLTIVTRNLDEFFMKRVGGLKQQRAAGVSEEALDGRTPTEQWTAVLEEARDLAAVQDRCYREEIRPALREAGIDICEYDALAEPTRAALDAYFERSVLPTLTPLSVTAGRSFPFISNLSLSLAVLTRGDDGEERFSRVKIPGNRPRLVRVDAVADTEVPAGEERSGTEGRHERAQFVLLEELVAANLDRLFPNVEVVDHATFRVTRNAEVRRNEDVAEGLIEAIEGVLRDRRFATAVRLEVASDMPERARELVVDRLGLEDREVFDRDPPLDFRDLRGLLDLDRPDLKLPAWTPRPHPRLIEEDRSVFAEIRRDDLLVHHPYHSFTDTVQRFLDEAARDPDVLAIKAAIYRTEEDSAVISRLIEAARNGKQVAVMVELKARFDEENNLRWIRRLEEEGVHVAYGTGNLKAHSKVALVVREEDEDVRLYSHVGTGNYHAETATTYADLGLMTADRAIGGDLVKVFNFFTGHGFDETYERLLVAPRNMRRRFTELIRREADHAREGRDARIVAKLNALEDPEIVRELYAASRAGVEIDLLVRGICRLRPGIDGVSESVTVSSIVGRFLEHSRIYYFENDGDSEYYVGSADWMTRNLDRRVETVAPVADPDLRAELDAILEILRADNRKRWEMRADGTYEQCRPGPEEAVHNAQERLMERAVEAVEAATRGRQDTASE